MWLKAFLNASDYGPGPEAVSVLSLQQEAFWKSKITSNSTSLSWRKGRGCLLVLLFPIHTQPRNVVRSRLFSHLTEDTHSLALPGKELHERPSRRPLECITSLRLSKGCTENLMSSIFSSPEEVFPGLQLATSGGSEGK